ncbi:hypothetical protein E4T56_gene13124 [Termitomyces sp. T112]|nr:hypothetical protein E4T56_gene13124 [Termitomyces sp. T112]
MFARVSSVLALALCASASVLPRTNGQGQCNTGEMQCCNKVAQGGDGAVTTLAGVLDIIVPLTDVVGLGCSSVLPLGSTQCSQQTICCQNNNFNGVIVLGCTPVNVSV